MHDWKTTPLFKSPFKSCPFQKAKSPASFYYSDRFFETLPLLFTSRLSFLLSRSPSFIIMIMRSLLFPFRSAAWKGGREGRKKKSERACEPAADNTMTRARPALGEGPGEPVWELRSGLATSTQHARQGACAFINIHEGRARLGHASSPRLTGRGVRERTWMGPGLRNAQGGRAYILWPQADPALGSSGGRVGRARVAPSGPTVGAPGVGAGALSERAASAFQTAGVSCGSRPRRRSRPREPGPLPGASERLRGALFWRRRGGRTCRRLLARRRRAGQKLLGPLHNFPGARLAADPRESLGRAPRLPNPSLRSLGRLPASSPNQAGSRAAGTPRPHQACEGLAARSGGLGTPGRSARIAPVGGLLAPLWVARRGPGKDHLTTPPTAEFDFSGVAVETDAIFHLEAGLAISSDTPGYNQGQKKPAGRLKPLPACFLAGLLLV
ncbi:uncharacterized protein LOC111753432 [Cavia porcellus]|uniref:uncharacterized protein LOC111753432 n=1 Tax=Cavia porcellus TaxID=10141 RepID=UPI002FDF68DC